LNEQPVFDASRDAGINTPIREYLDLARRRKLWIILLTLGVWTCIAVVAMRLPNVYRAETVILVDPQKVPDSVVPTNVSDTMADRLATIRQEVMSPTQLGLLIKEMNLYPKLRAKVSEQELVSRMQKSTSIGVVDSGGQRLSALRISFTDTDRSQVALAANRIASLFIERNLQARQKHFNGVSQVLETELQETKHQLEEKEHLLEDVRSRYTVELPESKQSHIEAMNVLRDQLRNSQDQVKRDRQSKVDIQSMAGRSTQTIDRHQQATASKSPYQAQLQKLDRQLKDMQARYGPNYPDVRKLRNEINQLKAKAESEKTGTSAADPQLSAPTHQARNPVVEAQVTKLDQDIEGQTKMQAKLEKQIQYHVGKLQQVPVFEQQIAGLMGDCDSLRNHYNQLQAKKLDAVQAGERFEVLDSAVPPDEPAGPKRGIMIVGGFFFGLMCGIGVAFLVEVSDKSVRHEREAAQIFGKPVLAGIPKITSAKEHAWALCRTASLTVGTAAAAVAFGLMISRFVS
jgi:succinoglycan biosynthesis transport protein ExoP